MLFGVQNQGRGSAVSTSETAEGAANVGSLLCATRMRLGKDLQDVAEVLRIRYTYLVAIEDGRYEDLPGMAYALGFVRAYSDYLGLDGEELIRRFKDECAGITPSKIYEYPVRPQDTGIPSGALILIAMVLGVFTYGSWYGLTAADRSPVEIIQKAPAQLISLLNSAPSEPAAPNAGSAIALEPSAPGDTTVAAVETDAANLEPVTPADAPQAGVMQAGPLEPVGEVTETDVAVVPEPEPQAAETPATGPVQEEEVGFEVAELAPSSQPTPVVEASTPSEQEIAEGPEPAQPVAQSADVAPVLPQEKPDPVPLSNTGEPNAPADAEVARLASVAEQTDPAPDADAEPTPTGDVAEQIAAPEQAARSEQVASLPPVVEVDQAPANSAPPEPAVIELRATSDSWIQVRSGEDLMLTRLLRKGEIYTVPEQSGLTLMTDNAGGLDVFVNDEKMPALGDQGVVRRGVPLEPEYFRGQQSGAAAAAGGNG